MDDPVLARLSVVDRRRLEHALQLALSTDPAMAPDPFVGAAIADTEGRVRGRGYHATHGDPHAEPLALADAGEAAHGATLYCNLEPRGYDVPGKRQPRCTGAIIAAGVARVVIGQVDPHPRVDGPGIRRLLAAGIRVDLAADEAPYRQANRASVARHERAGSTEAA